MHGKGKRTEAAHARAARASEGHGRALLPCAFLLALVALLLAPTRAIADGGGGSHSFGGDGSANYRTVLYSSNYADGVQYIVGADNKYDAAAYICGQTSTQVAAYDLVTRYKLSATENDFAALADRLERVWPGWNEETLGQNLASVFARVVNGTSLWDVMTNILTGSLSHFQIYYWQNNVDCDIYAIDTTSNAVTLARDDLQEILNGGGGSGDNDGGDGVYIMQCSDSARQINVNSNTMSNYSFMLGNERYFPNALYNTAESVLYPKYSPDIKLKLSQSMSDSLGDLDTENCQMYIFSSINGGEFAVGMLVTDAEPTVSVLSNSYGQYKRYTWTNDSSKKYYTVGGASTFSTVFKGQYDSSTGIYQLTGNARFARKSTFNTEVSMPFAGENKYYYIGSVEGGGETNPDPDPPSGPGNWPDPPSNPTTDPPTVPDPPQNPEPDPPSTPTAPTPPPLEPPTNVIIPTGTTPQDYTPWLRAILEQLQTLTDELASHCVHLQEEIQTSVNELQDTLIYRFNSLESQIWDLFNGLEDYLHDLAAWLAEQLSFNVNVDPYDDSSVLYWLKKIYSRLGNQPKAPTTVIDPDPTEPFDFWAWLMGLIANTVGGIIGDLVGDVAGLLDLFKDKFPFSIPWDIAALLTLLDGTRATPVFDVKLAAVPGWWQETNFRIDLTPFDSVAAACRTMVNIIWVMALVMKTNWMLETMDNATSFGERFARKVARTS